MNRILAACALAAFGGALALGCLGAAGNKVWAKAKSAYAAPGDYERAESACGGNQGLPDVSAGPGRPEFIDCMRGHAWVLVRRP
jgi:hypothetical protein